MIRLVSDIGGTNARFVLTDGTRLIEQTRVDVAVADYPDFEDAFADVLDQLPQRPSTACFSVAGPVINNTIDFTNSAWTIDGDSLTASTGIECKLINDFYAVVNCLPELRDGDTTQIGAHSKTANGGLVAVGPGTGLGVGGGAYRHGVFVPLGGEGGHLGFSPQSELEFAIHRFLLNKFHFQKRVSTERLCSGPGLVNLYHALAFIEGRSLGELPNPKEITAEGLANPASFERTVLEMFCGIYGDIAGDLAMVYGASRGVYLTGGVTNALRDFLPTSRFRTRFEAKGRLSPYVSHMPTYIITHPAPGLLGAAAYLEFQRQ